MDEREDDEDAGGGGHEEHQLRVLDKVNTELLDLQLALHPHVDVLGALREEEVERVEVYDSFPPLYLLCAADTWGTLDIRTRKEGGEVSLPQLRLVNVVTMMQQKRTSIQAISRTYLRRGVIRQVNYRDGSTHMRKMKVAVATLPLTLPT